jgi:adenylate kinase family enzyme
MTLNKRQQFEVANVIKLVDTSKYSYHQQKIIKDITECRTEALGKNANPCSVDGCDNYSISYNSCRNRSCPKCGWKKQQDWIMKIAVNILPCKHFHAVFTIPHEFNNIFLYNKSVFSALLFKASSQAILDTIKMKWNAKGGYTSVLHTWGSNLSIHPHVHMIVPAGGFCYDTGKWVGFKKDFLVHKKALSLRFRNIFMKKIKKLIRKGKLIIPSCHGYLNNDASLLDFFEKPHSKKWNCHIQKTFGGETQVIKYLGRYIHRMAISNSRIKNIDIEKEEITFIYKDYKNKNFNAVAKLSVVDFLRRFMHHSCDKGFQRVRHGGIYANAVKKENVFKARLKVYGEWCKPVCVLKEVYKIEESVYKILASNSICECCAGEVVLDSA